MSRPTPGPDLLTLIDQARDATRELRAAINDVKAAKRDAEDGIAKLMQDAVTDHLDAIVKREVEQVQGQLKQFAADLYAKVAKECERLQETYMRGEARHSVSLDEVMAARQVLRKWNAEGDQAKGNGR
jgi:DNA primase large subunit